MINIRQIEYKVKNFDNLSRIGEITLKNKKRIETPINWMGLSIAESVDFQFEAFRKANVTNFMSNVYDLKYQDKKGIRDSLITKFVKEGLYHKVDSGGFQIMKQEMAGKRKLNLNPEIVYQVQSNLPCDIGVILDVPLGTNNDLKSNYKKIDRTIENFSRLLKIYDDISDDFSILPVIHGHKVEMIDYAIAKIQDLLGDPLNALGIGSLVPMVKNIRNSSN